MNIYIIIVYFIFIDVNKLNKYKNIEISIYVNKVY